VEICGKLSGAGGVVARSLLQAVVCGDWGASQRPLLACSACAGDYEDPDRTAWTPDPEELRDENANGDEFPAKEG
jgi:hypothetical protein